MSRVGGFRVVGGRTARRGFTIVELMLAMTAVTILLVFITMLVMNINSIYRKGIALKEVNAASRAIIDDMMRTIAGSPGQPVAGAMSRTLSDGGVFCTGSYSYVWKHATASRTSGSSVNNNYNFRLMKLRDAGRAICAGAEQISANISATEATELLSSAEMDLALYDLRIFTPTTNPVGGAGTFARQTFYSVTFTLGTLTGINLEAGSIGREACHPPVGFGIDEFDYCAANKFNFAVRAGGGV